MLLWIIFLLLIFFPKVVISSIPNLSSALRIDLILATLFLLSYVFYRLRDGIFLKANKINLLILFAFITFYVVISKNVIVALGQCVIYLSIFSAFLYGANMDIFYESKKIKALRIFLFLNIFIHIFFIVFDLPTLTAIYISDAGEQEVYDIFGRYGISSMPFQFSLYVASYFFILICSKNKLNGNIVIGTAFCFIALITGDSRISLFALAVAISGIYSILSLPILFLLSGFFESKALSAIGNYSNFYEDPSLGMRLVNLDAYLDWLNLSKLYFGGGAQSFLEFSTQYGLPGPLDMGFIRLVSEFGLLGVFLVGTFFIFYLSKNYKMVNGKLLGRVLIFLFLYSLLNEGLIAARSGHILLFVIGLLFFKPVIKFTPKLPKASFD